VVWTKVEAVLGMCAKFLRSWMMLNKLEDRWKLEAWAKELES
jgi:hypothetical protein